MAVLAIASGVGQLLKHRGGTNLNPAAVKAFTLRLRSYWLMCAVLAGSFLIGDIATVVMFGLISFWALREFITLTPTRPADHRALFWVFFLFTPLQFVLVGMGEAQYGLYTVLIPVYAFLFVMARVALAGDYKRFLERTAKIQSGLMVCVYCLSHAPALLDLHLQHYSQSQNARLLFFFVLIVQMADALGRGVAVARRSSTARFRRLAWPRRSRSKTRAFRRRACGNACQPAPRGARSGVPTRAVVARRRCQSCCATRR